VNGKLGDYVLEAEIGRGGMARVYRARHAVTGAVRAIKTLEQPGDVEAILRFRREAEALARVGGAVAVSIHEIGTHQGRLFYVMDLMPGGSLAERLARRGRFPWREAVALGVALARSLATLHDHGLIHRDMKPANILFADDGAPRLADLGCVRDITSASITASGAIVGTLGYMAPEQLRGDPVGPAADVFALAAIVHELVSGSVLYHGSHLQQLRARPEVGRRPRLAAIDGAPQALDALVDRALSPDERARPAAREIASLLEGIAAGETAPRGRGLAILALALALVGSLLILAFRSRAETPLPSPVAPRTPPSPLAPSSGVALATRRLEAAAVTSADVPVKDLEAVVAAKRGDLIAQLARKGAFYALADLDRLMPGDRRDPTHGPLETLWVYAALASGDPSLRAEVRRRLGDGGNLAHMIAIVDAIVAAKAGQLPGALPGSLPDLDLLSGQLPPAALAGLLAPLEPLCRAEALASVRRRFLEQTGEVDSPASYLKALLLPQLDHLPAVFRVELAIMHHTLALSLADERTRPQVKTRWSEVGWSHTTPETRGKIAAPLRRFGTEFVATATSLEGVDALLAAAAVEVGLACLRTASEYEDKLDDPTFEERSERALAALERPWSSAEDELTARAISHELHFNLAIYQSQRASESDAVERARLADQSLAHARAALALLPPRDPERPPGSGLRSLDVHFSAVALLLREDEHADALVAEPQVMDALVSTSWVRSEILRRQGKREEALQVANAVRGIGGGQRTRSGDDYIGAIAVSVLARIELGQLDDAASDLDLIADVAPAVLPLPGLRPEALRRRLEAARGR
jgi:hypothetical protein